MEVEMKPNSVSDYDRQVFQEILPFYDANDDNDDDDVATELSCSTDAVEAVKLDPAVLEAVTLENPPVTPPPAGEYHEPRARSSASGSFSSRSSSSSFTETFESMVCAQRDALLALTPQQMDLLMGYVETLRRQRIAQQRAMECAFCKNNGEPESWYSLHALKNSRGRIRCPVLRAFRCPRCGATGDWAHTIKYCPENKIDLDRRSNCSSQDFSFF